MSNENNNPQEKEVTAMPTKQYYETVDVEKELPPDEPNCYFVMWYEKGVCNILGEAMWNFEVKGKFDVSDDDDTDIQNPRGAQPTHWLRPVDLSELIREVAAGGWDACRNWVVDESCPDKTEYINSLIK